MSADLYNKNKGREAGLLEELQARETRLRCGLEQLQAKADPLEALDALDGEGIAALGVQIGNELVDYRKLQADLANVRRALGR